MSTHIFNVNGYQHPSNYSDNMTGITELQFNRPDRSYDFCQLLTAVIVFAFTVYFTLPDNLHRIHTYGLS